MNNLELANQIFQLCIVPLLGILTAYLVSFIKTKSAELIKSTDNEIAKKYMTMLTDTVSTCVVATNQTYVNALKETNAFDKEAQKIAFEKTTTAVKGILSEEAKTYLSTIYGDLDWAISNMIEEEVSFNKATTSTVLDLDTSSLN